MALTPKQEAFCQAVASGKTYSDSYRLAYDAENMQSQTINVAASQLLADHNISIRVDEIKKELADKALWSREDSIRTMIKIIERKIIEDEKEFQAAQDKDIIAAVKVINEMQGFNAPTKNQTELSGTIDTKNISDLTDEELKRILLS